MEDFEYFPVMYQFDDSNSDFQVIASVFYKMSICPIEKLLNFFFFGKITMEQCPICLLIFKENRNTNGLPKMLNLTIILKQLQGTPMS